MPSTRQPPAKPIATIADATAKTRSVIEDLQARLTADARSRIAEQATTPPPAEPEDVNREESVDDLERQLQAYFERATPRSTRTKILDELRNRVIDGVVDRILVEWATLQPGASPAAGLGPAVMERLIERVLDEFGKATQSSKTP